MFQNFCLKKIEDIEFPDFHPFMGYFCKYKKQLSEVANIALMTNGIESLRNNEHVRGLIKRMFDYDLEVEELEREIFSIPDRMEITFNYIDLSFQLFPVSSDEVFKLIARHLNDLRKYYDRKACLNFNHSEKIFDIFRFCLRRDPYLSKYLDVTTEGLDESQSNLMETAQTSSNTSIAPQPSLMEMDTQSKFDVLVSKEVSVSEFEKTRDGLKGDGQNLLAEFVDWEVSGPTYTFNELRNELCGDAKFKFDVNKVSLFGLYYSCKESKKE